MKIYYINDPQRWDKTFQYQIYNLINNEQKDQRHQTIIGKTRKKAILNNITFTHFVSLYNCLQKTLNIKSDFQLSLALINNCNKTNKKLHYKISSHLKWKSNLEKKEKWKSK